jgi:hypothetical protein
METLTILLIGVAAALGLVSLALGSFVCKAHTDPQREGGTGVSAKEDVAQAGCSDTVTPCNGERNAGVQVLNISNFAKEDGPWGRLQL